MANFLANDDLHLQYF